MSAWHPLHLSLRLQREKNFLEIKNDENNFTFGFWNLILQRVNLALLHDFITGEQFGIITGEQFGMFGLTETDRFTLISVKLSLSCSMIQKKNITLLESNSIRLIVNNFFDHLKT